MAEKERRPETLHPAQSPGVLILGSGPAACAAAAELAAMRWPVHLCCPERDIDGNPRVWGGGKGLRSLHQATVATAQADSRIRITAPAEVLQLSGSPGDFQVTLRDSAARSTETVRAVVLADEPSLRADFEAWGLDESKAVRSLSWVEEHLASQGNDPVPSAGFPATILFLCGYTHASTPFSQMRALQVAIEMAFVKERRVFFVTEDLKVAHPGMERLARQAREAGVLFVKSSGTRPGIRVQGEGAVVSYYDEALEESLEVRPDLLILEEACEPPKGLSLVAATLGVDLDGNGFLQADNVYLQPISTPRTGIWVVGPAKGPLSLEEGIEEAKAAALEIDLFFRDRNRIATEERLLFDETRCGRCLTCYRSCPHGAISCAGAKPRFYALACRACGICAAACPMDAIQIAEFTDDALISQIRDALLREPDEGSGEIARVIVFCCENSALESARLAALKGLSPPAGFELVGVPCAGRVDPLYLLEAFRYGADGVMVLGCHPESCRSISGNTAAQRRVEIARKTLEEVGLEKERLFFGTLGPATSQEFARLTAGMAETLRNLRADG